MHKRILLGDEAVAKGAIDAGISGAYAYPGTPSTEIFEFIHRTSQQEALGIHASWSSNEKVAYEEALGMSYAGKRALVSFKHVGLNVAADPFMNSAVSGVYGGVVVAVADDPSMHSSQNEQDSRFYAAFAQIPCFEPSDQQQAYSMVREAFDLSEKYQTPVMLRLVTRLAHSRSIVTTSEPRPQNRANYCPDFSSWTLLPPNARKGFELLLDKQAYFRKISEEHESNRLVINGVGRPGIVASGIARGYVEETLSEKLGDYNVLFVGFYPAPVQKLARLVECSSEIRVFEDGFPFLEKAITSDGLNRNVSVKGKLSGYLSRSGELTPDAVKAALGVSVQPGLMIEGVKEVLRPRPPVLCDGCPHGDTYQAIRKATQDYGEVRVLGDIGCYTLGYYTPYDSVHACICMGASISMASGVSHAGIRPVLCVIGDSTFTHSGLTPLLDAVRENTDMTVLIMDNSIVAMTGGQPTMVTDENLVDMISGIGLDRAHIRVIRPLARNLDQNVKTIQEELDYPGLSVIISRRECVTYYKEIKTAQRAREGEEQ